MRHRRKWWRRLEVDRIPKLAVPLENAETSGAASIFDLDPILLATVLIISILVQSDRDLPGRVNDPQSRSLHARHDYAVEGLSEGTLVFGESEEEMSVIVSGGYSCTMRSFLTKKRGSGDLVRAQDVLLLCVHVSQSRWRVHARRSIWDDRAERESLARMEMIAVFTGLCDGSLKWSEVGHQFFRFAFS
jgi:hypothetical protein